MIYGLDPYGVVRLTLQTIAFIIWLNVSENHNSVINFRDNFPPYFKKPSLTV
jgi:hypothetical protein